jgi:hypothetical protein
LTLGLTLALLHRPVADFMLHQERALAGMFRQRGLLVPAPPTTETLRTVYFSLGIVLALVALIRIWLSIHPGIALLTFVVR